MWTAFCLTTAFPRLHHRSNRLSFYLPASPLPRLRASRPPLKPSSTGFLFAGEEDQLPRPELDHAVSTVVEAPTLQREPGAGAKERAQLDRPRGGITLGSHCCGSRRELSISEGRSGLDHPGGLLRPGSDRYRRHRAMGIAEQPKSAGNTNQANGKDLGHEFSP